MPLTGFQDLPDRTEERKLRGPEVEIDIHGLGLRNASRAPGVSGRRRVRASVHDLMVLKSCHGSSPLLTLATLRGQHFDEIVLTMRKDSGKASLDILNVTLTNCILTDHRAENDGADDRLTEMFGAVDIEFEQIGILCPARGDDHSARGGDEVRVDILAGSAA